MTAVMRRGSNANIKKRIKYRAEKLYKPLPEAILRYFNEYLRNPAGRQKPDKFDYSSVFSSRRIS